MKTAAFVLTMCSSLTAGASVSALSDKGHLVAKSSEGGFNAGVSIPFLEAACKCIVQTYGDFTPVQFQDYVADLENKNIPMIGKVLRKTAIDLLMTGASSPVDKANLIGMEDLDLFGTCAASSPNSNFASNPSATCDYQFSTLAAAAWSTAWTMSGASASALSDEGHPVAKSSEGGFTGGVSIPFLEAACECIVQTYGDFTHVQFQDYVADLENKNIPMIGKVLRKTAIDLLMTGASSPVDKANLIGMEDLDLFGTCKASSPNSNFSPNPSASCDYQFSTTAATAWTTAWTTAGALASASSDKGHLVAKSSEGGFTDGVSIPFLEAACTCIVQTYGDFTPVQFQDYVADLENKNIPMIGKVLRKTAIDLLMTGASNPVAKANLIGMEDLDLFAKCHASSPNSNFSPNPSASCDYQYSTAAATAWTTAWTTATA